MAKSIKRKNVKKSVSVKVGDKMVKTTCKTFGAPLKNEKGEFVSKCKTCSVKKSDVCAACSEKFIELNPPEKKVVTKRIANNDMENLVVAISENSLLSRKALVEKMAKDSARSEGGWKTMVGACFLAIKHLEGKGSGKGAYHWAAQGIKEGIVDFKALKKYVAKKENKKEGIIGRSVQYVYTVNRFMPEKTEA